MASTGVLTLATLYLFASSAVALPTDFDSKSFWAKPEGHNPHWDLPSFSFNPLPTGTAYYPSGTGTGLPGPTATGPSPTGYYKDHAKRHDDGDYHLGYGDWAHGWHGTSFPTAFPSGNQTGYPTASGHYPTATPDCDDAKVKRHEDESPNQRFEGPRKAGEGQGKGPYWDNGGNDGGWAHEHASLFPTVTGVPGPTAAPTGAVPSGGWY